MRTFDEIAEAAVEGRAFSNMSEYERWAWNYCRFCVHGNGEQECDVTGVSMIGLVPAEWTRTGVSTYDCSEFDGALAQGD
jgi:hypothetical protein